MALAAWNFSGRSEKEIAFTPARVILQDFTGVPAVADLAAMRDALAEMWHDPRQVNPLQQVDLVIDHSVNTDSSGAPNSLAENMELEFERNEERYRFLRWGQQAFCNFRVVPPGTGIIHQVNLEYLAPVVMNRSENGQTLAYPDTLVGTDSHTTMINGLGVLGWGVGGIEAEAAMLGQPISMLIPEVIGFKLIGKLPEGSTATDAVLTITEILRKEKVVGKFVEFFGPGVETLSLADRATIANMAPEYGATTGFFPADHETLRFLRMTGRSDEQIKWVEAYLKEQKLFRENNSAEPVFFGRIEFDLGQVEPCVAGPKRPQDRVPLSGIKTSFRKAVEAILASGNPAVLEKKIQVTEGGRTFELRNGSIAIASITSCTNTSNPAVMLAAGLLAKKAVEKGLTVPPWVKTSLSPGSKVVTDYLREAGLMTFMEKLRFHVVGYGCMTCIGNSGPLGPAISEAIKKNGLIAVSVLSGNRNFEGRVNPLVRANYLASPPLVVAYALAGRVDIDWTSEPVGTGPDGSSVYLKDIWPAPEEIDDVMKGVESRFFVRNYENIFEGTKAWREIGVPSGDTFPWDPASSYVRKPPFFEHQPLVSGVDLNIRNARALAVLGDSVTTDHISPAGSIAKDSPAAKYLSGLGIQPKDFNSYGSRRGNHEVMMRGTFANIRLKNLLLDGAEGGYTRHFPDGELMSIYDAAMKYRKENVPLVIIAGKEYGSGSSRDWAAKGPSLLGVRAVIAESFERIHRSNLIGMGILPLQMSGGPRLNGLTGQEIYSVEGIGEDLTPGKKLTVKVTGAGQPLEFEVVCRIDTPVEFEYYKGGGILPYVLKKMMKKPG
jgi:aconitate hydratase